MIAWLAAGARPELVERLAVLCCPHPALMLRRIWWPRQLRRSWYIFAFQLPRIPERRITSARFPELAFRGMAASPEAFDDDDLQVYREAIGRPGAATAMLMVRVRSRT